MKKFKKWPKAIAAVQSYLTETAARKGFATYDEVADIVNKTATSDKEEIALTINDDLLHELLFDVAKEFRSGDQPLYTAIISYNNEEEDGILIDQAFYDHAQKLGYKFENTTEGKEAFWIECIRECFRKIDTEPAA